MKQYVIKKNDLAENIRTVQQRCGQARLIAVLKGQGYGLGLVEFARVLDEQGVDFFAVSEMTEAVTLRQAGFSQQILLLTATTLEEELRRGVEYDITMAVGSALSLQKLNRLAEQAEKTVTAHLKIDTGFGRFGFMETQLLTAADAIKQVEHVHVDGVFSHFSFSFSPQKADVAVQFDRFMQALSLLEEQGVTFSIRHICNSCAFLQYPEYHLDAVRVGSALLGRLPIPNRYGLIPIGQLVSAVMEVKTLPKGCFVGYANTYQTKRETTVAIVPVGYKDGFGVSKSKDTFRFFDILRYLYHDLRSLHQKLTVTIHGETVPVIGRVGMFHVVADVTGRDVKIGDICVLPANPLLVSQTVPRVYE